MTIIHRVFKAPRWVTMFAAAGFVVSVSGTGLTISSSGINTLSIMLCAIAIIFAFGLADSLLSHVYITPKTLGYFSNFHGRVLQRAEIQSVLWNAGCPVIVVLTTGDKLRLPALDDSLKMANGIRAWLKRSYVGIENSSNTIAEAREVAILIAQQIVSGEMEPYDGAMKIWKQALDKLETHIPDDLWPFKSNASAIEDCLWNSQESGSDNDILIAQCKKEIVQTAELLVRESIIRQLTKTLRDKAA